MQLTAFGARSERFYSFPMQRALLATEPQGVWRDHPHCNQRGAAGAITRITSISIRCIACITTNDVDNRHGLIAGERLVSGHRQRGQARPIVVHERLPCDWETHHRTIGFDSASVLSVIDELGTIVGEGIAPDDCEVARLQLPQDLREDTYLRLPTVLPPASGAHDRR